MNRLRRWLGYTVFFALFGVMAISMVTALVLPEQNKLSGIYALDQGTIVLYESDAPEQEGKQKILTEKNTLYTHVIHFGYGVIKERMLEPRSYHALDLTSDIFYPPKHRFA